ncbi:MAG: threonine--tRNA ligase [Candidatus Pacebacteria bacterium]|nr:threonine--tRNA ligase [Candidatus Paceibacterota bacterium]
MKKETDASNDAVHASNSAQSIEHIRHSLAHLLATATVSLYPDTLLTIGPAVENGFYYDMDFTAPLKDADLPVIEQKMRDILKDWTISSKKGVAPDACHFLHKEVSVDEARALFANNPYKLELIEEINAKGEKITLYTVGSGTEYEFTDLCRGGHADDMSTIDQNSFALTRLAGAYWRGDEKNKMLTRVYGLAFQTKDELKAYQTLMEEARKRDHRILGEKLNLFCFDESIGKGLPLWLPKGNIVKEQLEEWAKDTEKKWGYQRVTTPIITKENLFYTSGHLPLYKESMYAPIQIEDENYYIKPMNCPFHHKIFSARMRSYKELPLRVAEYGWCHRYEDSGSLFGLMRVRGMQMNDAHIYVQKEKAVEEFVQVIKLHEYYYKTLGIKNYEMELALRDPSKMDKYHGNEEDWKDAERMTIEAMEQSGVPYKVVQEGAAFYGPKMDFQIFSSIGRAFTASTNQLDLYMGKAFELEYVDNDGVKKTPAVIHRAPLGTHERFIGFLIEHFGGAFPVWLSPVQVKIVPIGERQMEYATILNQTLLDADIRVELDSSNDGLGKKIRSAKQEMIPYVLVIGDKEIETNTVTVESRTGNEGAVTIEDFIGRITSEIKNRSL